MSLTRRTVAFGAASAALAAAGQSPAVAQAASKALKFIPGGDLSSLDPVVTTGDPIRNHAYMVYDTLFATDDVFRVHPQMAEGSQVSPDGLTWTIGLRDGLRFHDNAPVLARDCVASIRRWSARDPLGQTIMALTDELAAVDDRTFRFRLREPFPMLAEALGKVTSPVPFMMPERVAMTDSNTQIRDATGSGPFRFLADEWMPGSHAAYARFDGYAPRSEPPNGAAGGKVAYLNRVEWHIMPDPGTAAAALQRGEMDWYEQVDSNLVQLMRASRDIVVGSFSPGYGTFMRMNHLQPPFDDVRTRQAVLAAVDQTDYLEAMTGDASLYEVCKSFFFCGTPMASTAGSEAMTASVARAKQLLAEGRYNGEKIVILSPSDLPWLHAAGLVTEDLLKRLGMNVELVATDLGTFYARRNSVEPVGKGGWSIFHTGTGSVNLISPVFHLVLRSNGRAAWPGWPTDPVIEQLRLDWIRAADQSARVAIAAEVQRQAFRSVPYVPLGQRRSMTAYRKTVSGLQQGSAPFAWNVKKA